MIEAESRWAQQEKQMIQDEVRMHKTKQAAIEAEKKTLASEKRTIDQEAKTARYESIYQQGEHARAKEFKLTILRQKEELEKMLPAQNDEEANHPGRTEFPDLRPIPGQTFDPSIIPAHSHQWGEQPPKAEEAETPSTPLSLRPVQPSAPAATKPGEPKQPEPQAKEAKKEDIGDSPKRTGLTAKESWDQDKDKLSKTWKKDSQKAETVKEKAD